LKEARLRVKDAAIWRGRVGLILVVGASVVCRTDSFRDAFPSPRETLRAVGRRLSRLWSERDLSAIAWRDAAILDLLEPADRQALGRGYL
jgi:acid phosphatase type 7